MVNNPHQTRRQFLALLATGSLVARSGRAGATGSEADTAPGENARSGDDGGFPRRSADRRTISPIGTYRGDTRVEFLYEGERRSARSGVVVQIDEPIEHEGQIETNPFSLFIDTVPSISEAGGAYEGMYSVYSSGVYFQGASAPGLDYRPPDTWMEQHWDLTFANGQLAGSLTDTNSSINNAMWYEQPGSSTDIGYGPPIVFEAAVVPSGYRVGATIEATITEERFTATIAGSTPQIDAFEITITAERPRL